MDSGTLGSGGARGGGHGGAGGGFPHGRDMWSAVRNGSVHDVEIALAYLKKGNGNINVRNAYGSTALHIAVWRNHLPIIRRLLAAGADPDARDGESGWSSLHRALHFGHIAVAGVLIDANASLTVEDTKYRTPIDLTSGPVKQCLAGSSDLGGKEVFSWGSGSNYQLGIPSTGILRVPGRIDGLQGQDIVAVASAKFHSVALTADGEVYSWGFGRGGRLGHSDFDIHSGQVAVITPRPIAHSFGCRGVRVIAAAKHHTVIATDGGEVYTWGSNREGRLGYPSVDTQPTPRRVSTLKVRVVAVAAADKHSAVLTEAGEVYTWGCNKMGQLGYGTSKSISNYIPRIVESLKGKKLVSVSCAKHHTVVLGGEGEVLTWGYKLVNPHRISVVRNTKKAGARPLKFHISEPLHVVAISAGLTHSSALSKDGLLFYWFSADPLERCRQVMSLAGHQAVAVSSSKYRTVVATSVGDVYAWDDSKATAETIPVPFRVNGIKHVAHVSVGENHSVVVAAVFIPEYPLALGGKSMSGPSSTSSSSKRDDDLGDVDPDIDDPDFLTDSLSPGRGQVEVDVAFNKPVPSLVDMCQRVAVQSILEPKNALQVLEFADSLGADILKGHCEELIVRNLDYILTMAPVLLGHVRPSLLADVERVLDACSMQPWSHRRLPTPSATLPVIVDSEEEEDKDAFYKKSMAKDPSRRTSFNSLDDSSNKLSEGFLQMQNTENYEAIMKQLRAARKKLQQIEALEVKQSRGQVLDDQQLGKIQTKQELQRLLLSLESGVLPPEPQKKFEDHDKGLNVDITLGIPSSEGGEEPKTTAGNSKRTRRPKQKHSRGQGSNELALAPGAGAGSGPLPALADNPESSASNTSAAFVSAKVVEKSLQPSSSDSFVQISGFKSTNSKRREVNPGIQNSKDVLSPQFKTLIVPGPPAALLPEQQQPPLPKKMTPLGKKVVKGGLSVFLSGALDEPIKASPPPPPPPVTPKAERPAWGGAHAAKESASLREIQSEQKNSTKKVFSHAVKIGSGGTSNAARDMDMGASSSSSKHLVSIKQVTVTSKHGDHQNPNHSIDDAASSLSTTKRVVPLSQFVRTSPIAVTNNSPSPSSKASSSHPANSPPPWVAGSSSSVAVSLHDIQLQQGKSNVQQRPSHSRGSPHLASPVGTSGFLATNAPGGSEQSGASGGKSTTPNRWFKPEVDSPSTLHCIQIEEKAMKELGKLYKNVKLVRNDGS